MFSASTKSGPNASGEPKDPQFNYVTMLLHGDGTNGAQNNTFVDSSSNNYTITRTGNTTQGSFSPYGPNWSNYFPTGLNYLSTASNAAFGLGTGSFTFEAWIFTNGLPTFDVIGTSGSAVFYINSGFPTFYNGINAFTSSSAITANVWTHLAYVRSGGTLKIYINGVQTPNNFNASADLGSAGICKIANLDATTYFAGYISNFRIVKGIAVYTSNFTPSTSPLTEISGTSILTCQSNQFKDNSTNNFALTVTGTPSVQRLNPFGASATYTTSSIGGSAYFDGSSDYIKTTGTVGIANSAFTICFWFYPLSSSVIGLFDSGPNLANVFRNYPANTIQDQNTAGNVSFAGSYKINSWNWMCITKSGTSFTVYINNTNIATGTCSSPMVESNFTIGGINNGTDGSYNGYISDFQVLNTATVVSSPTSPITNESGKTYLLNFQNAGIYDNAMMNNLETVGNAQVSTSVVKYGTGSIYLDGTGDWLSTPPNANAAMGTADFTIEFWINSTQTSRTDPIGVKAATSTVGWWGLVANRTSSGQLEWLENTNSRISASSTNWNNGSWNHVAVTRSGSSVRMFVNGTQVGSTYTTSFSYGVNGTNNYALMIGYLFAGGVNSLNGYIDDLRITKGYARYTTTFTPPTAAFPNIGPT